MNTNKQSYRVVNGKLFVGIHSHQNAASVGLKNEEMRGQCTLNSLVGGGVKTEELLRVHPGTFGT